jgi:predicted AAA+ superfamily ATPase
MAMSFRDRVGRGFELLAEGLADTVDEVMTQAFRSAGWNDLWAARDAQKHGTSPQIISKDDPAVMLRAITDFGREFKDVLSRTHQAFASELRQTRNDWAHNKAFTSNDTARALDTIERLLLAVNAPDSAADAHKLRADLQRQVYEDSARHMAKAATVKLDPSAGLKPWREVIKPHEDVAKGDFTASEFAADLHLVHTGQATSPEYSDPVEFFSRTYLTEGLRDLLSRAVRRIGGDVNASPVVNLQTNFGGGKTHSMLALYHLFGGTPVGEYPQEVQDLLVANGAPELEALGVRRVAIVGNRMKAGSPLVKEDGTEVLTIWGELAWQLGGKEAYDRIASDDQNGTNPGESLRGLLVDFGPALILIDEWVAYARELVGKDNLRAGTFDTQFGFAQTLTETVAGVPGAMLVVSIPASDSNSDGPGNDIEIGGTNGQLALNRLQNVVRRVADQWRPSTKNESFEIVRRRLFQTPDSVALAQIGATAKAFVAMYRTKPQEFPRDASAASDEYEKRIRASYPLHPELLDRLYEDWSTLERFQRTRGVLKLVSDIVKALWASADSSPLILPGNAPLDDRDVNADLTQYLEDSWKPIIDRDIDGAASTAAQIDNTRTALGQRHVTRRVARTIFVGAAPRAKTARKGLDKQYVWLGTAIPGDALGNFAAALDELEQKSTYFYVEQGHYWFDTQASVTKTASDYAERLREDMELVWNEIVDRLRSEERARGEFDRVHIAPESSGDIPDLEDARLVIVHPRHARHKNDAPDAPASQWVRAALETRGSAQRIHRNSLVFLVADQGMLESLESATRTYLGWKRVESTAEALNLTAQQARQVADSVRRTGQTVSDRLRDTFVWAMYPTQPDPTAPFSLVADKVADSGRSMAEKVSDRLKRDAQLITTYGPQVLGMDLQDGLKNAWHDGRITVGEVWAFFTRYPFLPRLARRSVLDDAVRQAIGTVLVGEERFAVASEWDDAAQRYVGLIMPPNGNASIQVTDSTLLVDWGVAVEQDEHDHRERFGDRTVCPSGPEPSGEGGDVPTGTAGTGPTPKPPHPEQSVAEEVKTRFFGQVHLNPKRYGSSFSTISKEVLERLEGSGADLEIIIEIQARKPSGFTESEVRTISENAATLKFDDNGFATD